MGLAVVVSFLVIVFLLLVAFFGLIYPVWTIIECATSTLSNAAKAVWIIVMIFLWPIGSYLYGLFGSAKIIFRWISASAFLSLVIGLAAFLYFLNVIVDKSLEGPYQGIKAVQEANGAEISSEELLKLNNSLLVLEKEAQETWVRDFHVKLKAIFLLERFEALSLDRKITVDEYNDWMNLFELRKSTSSGDFLKKLKSKPFIEKQNEI